MLTALSLLRLRLKKLKVNRIKKLKVNRIKKQNPEDYISLSGFWFFCLLARSARFERATFRLGGGRSILLSYERILVYFHIEKHRQLTATVQMIIANGTAVVKKLFAVLCSHKPLCRVILDLLTSLMLSSKAVLKGSTLL